MTARYLGSYSIGVAIPQIQILQLQLLLDLQTQLEAAIKASVSITLTPPTLTASLEAALALVASLKAAIALGLPDVSISADFMIDIIAALKLQVDLLLELGETLGVAGLLMFNYEGQSSRLGAELGAEVTRVVGDQPTQGLLLVATAPEVFVALGKVMLTA